jgi:5'-nucleotidase
MVGDGSGAYPRTLTYQQAAVVQPFANTLVNMDLTGAQIKSTIEQQWQAAGAARPFLKLGISKGFTYTFDDTRPAGSRITGMWLDGTPIAPATVYSVTVNSFLASGGDGFTALNGGTGKQDTGKTDLQGMVDYMAAFGGGANSVPVDYRQNGVGVAFPASAPASYAPGDHVTFNVSSWSMTNPADAKDTAVVVTSGGATLGSFPLDNSAQTALPGFDTVGKASVDVVVPSGQATGPMALRLTGATTGTTYDVQVPVVRGADPVPPKVASTTVVDLMVNPIKVGKKAKLVINVTGANGVPVTGQANVTVEGETTRTITLVNGQAFINLGKFTKKGSRKIEVRYLGSDTLLPSGDTVKLKIKKK